MSQIGNIFNIQRDSTEDGPGIRTTVFMKGCPMRCPWCHNPEGMRTKPDLMWYELRCIGDGACLGVCPQNALTRTGNAIAIDRDRCTGCGKCVVVCPAGALEIKGSIKTADEVYSIVNRDKPFYNRSGGGLTVSGGEPALQGAFVQELFDRARADGIHTALDTCGGVDWNKLEPLVHRAELVLFDLKIFDEQMHREILGIPREMVFSNAIRISQAGVPMWIRTPVIPGYSDSDENIIGIARFIRENLPTAQRYDILAFNEVCSAKYKRLDRPWPLEGRLRLTEARMEELAMLARREGIEATYWSGLTK